MLVRGTSSALDSTPSTRIMGPIVPVAAGLTKRDGTARGSASFDGRLSIKWRAKSPVSTFCEATRARGSFPQTLELWASTPECNQHRQGGALPHGLRIR